MRSKPFVGILFLIMSFLAGCSTVLKTRKLYTDGSVRREGISVFVKGEDGQDILLRHGKWKSWHPNRQLASDVTYRRGEIVGVSRTWYDNGQLATINHHDENGLANGVSKVWDHEGKLLNETTFIRGSGTQLYYYPTGQLKSKISYVKNVAEGVGLHYNKDGSIKKRILYSKGKTLKSSVEAP